MGGWAQSGSGGSVVPRVPGVRSRVQGVAEAAARWLTFMASQAKNTFRALLAVSARLR